MKKVAIVGFAETKDMAPYGDEDFEIWGVNNLYAFVPRVTRIFQLHRKEKIGRRDIHGKHGDAHIQFLRETPIPIYMQDHYPDIPASIRYPIEEMVEEFGIPKFQADGKDPYFTNSISYMLALAIHEGFEEIHVYGVNMAVGSEYDQQRPSCEYYLGIAQGRGIKVVLPLESDLLRTRWMYGYEDEQREAWQAKLTRTIEEMLKRKKQSDQAIRDQQSVSDNYRGAIQAMQEMDKTWVQ